jgi:hypothetical protein
MLSPTLRRVLTATSFAIPALLIGMQSAQAEDLEFTLHNQSSSPITQFYVESTELNTWGENILTETINPGESATVTIADGKSTCMYGIRGIFSDGAVVEEEDLNLCELGSYTYNDKE